MAVGASIALVTGAAGFMGSHVVERLSAAGAKVRATDLPRSDTSFFQKLGVEFIGADLTQPRSLQDLFAGGVDRVFHLGAICNFSTPFKKLYQVNVQGVEQITRLALDARVKRFVHVSSTSLYGPYRGLPFREIDPREPQDDYGRSKREGEDVVWRRHGEGLPAIIARPCTVYGPRCTDGAGKVFSRPTAIQAIPGGGKQRLSNVRAEDVAEALLYLSRLDEAIGQAYNIADDSHPTIEEALALAARAFGTHRPALHLPLVAIRVIARAGGLLGQLRGRIPDLEVDAIRYLDADYLVDNSKLKRTGFQLGYPDFAAAIAQLGSRYRSDRAP